MLLSIDGVQSIEKTRDRNAANNWLIITTKDKASHGEDRSKPWNPV